MKLSHAFIIAVQSFILRMDLFWSCHTHLCVSKDSYFNILRWQMNTP